MREKSGNILVDLDIDPNESTIVYVQTRKNVEKICKLLKANGLKAGCYHAGLSSDEKYNTHDLFVKDKIKVIVATIFDAFVSNTCLSRHISDEAINLFIATFDFYRERSSHCNREHTSYYSWGVYFMFWKAQRNWSSLLVTEIWFVDSSLYKSLLLVVFLWNLIIWKESY